MKAIEFLGKSFFIFAVLSLVSCASLDSYSTSAYIENESDFAQKAFSAEYIDSWTGYKKRTYGLDEYFVDFDKTYFVSNKEYDAGSDTDYSFSSIKKHGGTLLKNGKPLFDIFISLETKKTVSRSILTLIGDCKYNHRGKRKCVFLTGIDGNEIPFNTKANLILKDNSIIPLEVIKVSALKAENDDGESYVLQTLFDQLCGAIIKIRGEEYAFLDFESKDRTIMLKNDFSQTLSEAEKDYVTSIIFLMCLFDDRFPNENTEPVINLDVHE